MPQAAQYLEPRYLGSHPAAAAPDAFQPLGLSQEELRAIDEGRAQPPARVFPISSFEYARPHGMIQVGEPAVPQFPIAQVPRDTSFAARVEHVHTRAAWPQERVERMVMPHEGFAAWPQERVERIVMPHEGFYGSQFSSKRYTLADRANWGDSTVAVLAGLADGPPQAQEKKIDREGEMIRSLALCSSPPLALAFPV